MEFFIDLDDSEISSELKEIINYINSKRPIFLNNNLKIDINIIFVESSYQRALNKQFRNLDRTTDVLSFNYFDEELTDEIFIDPYQAQKQAKRYNVSFGEEVIRLIIHGILHINGYDHTTTKQRKEMFELQENLLKECLKDYEL